MTTDDSSDYALVMPFLPVRSRGGPWDDQAYTAGYQMGLLDAALQAQPDRHEQTVNAWNGPQADLIAMRHGYRCEWTVTAETPSWMHLVLTKATREVPA